MGSTFVFCGVHAHVCGGQRETTPSYSLETGSTACSFMATLTPAILSLTFRVGVTALQHSGILFYFLWVLEIQTQTHMLLTRNDFYLFVLCVIELKDFIAEELLVAEAGDDGPKSQLSEQGGWGLGPEVRTLGGHHAEHRQLGLRREGESPSGPVCFYFLQRGEKEWAGEEEVRRGGLNSCSEGTGIWEKTAGGGGQASLGIVTAV